MEIKAKSPSPTPCSFWSSHDPLVKVRFCTHKQTRFLNKSYSIFSRGLSQNWVKRVCLIKSWRQRDQQWEWERRKREGIGTYFRCRIYSGKSEPRMFVHFQTDLKWNMVAQSSTQIRLGISKLLYFASQVRDPEQKFSFRGSKSDRQLENFALLTWVGFMERRARSKSHESCFEEGRSFICTLEIEQ